MSRFFMVHCVQQTTAAFFNAYQ